MSTKAMAKWIKSKNFMIGMYLDRCAVQRHSRNLDAGDLSMLQSLKDPIQDSRLRPVAHAGINAMPSAGALQQDTPLAALVGDLQFGIQDLQIRVADVTTLAQQAVLNQGVVRFCECHD